METLVRRASFVKNFEENWCSEQGGGSAFCCAPDHDCSDYGSTNMWCYVDDKKQNMQECMIPINILLSGGAIAGIAIAVVLIIASVTFLVYYAMGKKDTKEGQRYSQDNVNEANEIGNGSREHWSHFDISDGRS